jgi:hypothetical protein
MTLAAEANAGWLTRISEMSKLKYWNASFGSLFAGILLAGCGGGDDTTATPPAVVMVAPTISILSNRADLVSGGDALVQVVLPPSGAASDVRV